MAVKNPDKPHTIVAPKGIQQNYFAVNDPDGREVIRCATYDEALKEQARIHLRDSYTIR